MKKTKAKIKTHDGIFEITFNGARILCRMADGFTWAKNDVFYSATVTPSAIESFNRLLLLHSGETRPIRFNWVGGLQITFDRAQILRHAKIAHLPRGVRYGPMTFLINQEFSSEQSAVLALTGGLFADTRIHSRRRWFHEFTHQPPAVFLRHHGRGSRRATGARADGMAN
jgi:hypothetical protein